MAIVILLTLSDVVIAGRYVGCYKDNNNTFGRRDLPHLAYHGLGNTIESCLQKCTQKDYKYAGLLKGYFPSVFFFRRTFIGFFKFALGLQDSKFCWCGNAYGAQGVGKYCDARCSGNPQEICGGLGYNSIYEVNRSSMFLLQFYKLHFDYRAKVLQKCTRFNFRSLRWSLS